MEILLFPSTLLGIVMCLALLSARRLQRIGAGEELAHALALARRQRAPERRQERRTAASGCATATLLGNGEAGAGCRIVNVSRSGMRIAVAQSIAIGTQVHVAWDRKFFVGAVCHSTEAHGEHVVGLRLISSNH